MRNYKLTPFGQQPKINREFYDAIIECSDWKQDAPADELTRGQDLARTGWCKVCQQGFKPGGHFDRVRLVQTGVCESCDHAIEKWQIRDNKEVARINGKHWVIGAEYTRPLDPTMSLADIAAEAANVPNKQGRGCSGSVFVIQFNDGRTIVTNDLWGQGDVPEIVKHLLPDNAVFVEV